MSSRLPLSCIGGGLTIISGYLSEHPALVWRTHDPILLIVGMGLLGIILQMGSLIASWLDRKADSGERVVGAIIFLLSMAVGGHFARLW